jgi:type IV pilus assembly protein PilM
VDIGASGVKMLQLADEGDRPAVIASAHYAIPHPSTNGAPFEELVRRAISQALQQQPFQGREVIAALGIREFQMKNVRLPKMPAEELASAVEFEAQDRFGLDPEGTQFRHIPAGEVRHGNELKEEVMVFAVPDTVVQTRLGLLESCKLRPTAIDITPCAVARSFVRFLRRAEDASAVNVFADVGSCGTSVIITRGTELIFMKVIDVGGEHLNDAVAKAMDIAPADAAELRIRIIRGFSGRREQDRATVQEEMKAAVADAVRPLVERIAREIQLCLRYFAVTFRGQRPECLTLVGGEAHEPMLSAIIEDTAGIPCTIGHPLRGVGRLGLMAGQDRRSLLPAWAVASGLALRGSPWVGGGDETQLGSRRVLTA